MFVVRRFRKIFFDCRSYDIGELLSLQVDPTTYCSDIKSKTEMKIDEIEEKIKTLRKIKKALMDVSRTCSGRGPVSEYPILEALEK